MESSCWRSRLVVPSPWGRLRPVSSGPPHVEGWGLAAHDGILDTPCLPRNSWTSGAGHFTLWSGAPPKAPPQASGQPRSAPGSPGNLASPEPPSISLEPTGPVPPQLHGGEQGAVQGPPAAPAPGWVTFGTRQVKCGCQSPLGAFRPIC